MKIPIKSGCPTQNAIVLANQTCRHVQATKYAILSLASARDVFAIHPDHALLIKSGNLIRIASVNAKIPSRPIADAIFTTLIKTLAIVSAEINQFARNFKFLIRRLVLVSAASLVSSAVRLRCGPTRPAIVGVKILRRVIES